MKKFLLSSALIVMGATAFAQTSCPTNAKRNNGNNCLSGGGIEQQYLSTQKLNHNVQVNGISTGVLKQTTLVPLYKEVCSISFILTRTIMINKILQKIH